VKWLELTGDDLAEARRKAEGVAMIPVGSLERHGPHLPLGCDTLTIEYVTDRVAELEPVVVLPVIPYTSVSQSAMRAGAVHIRSDILLQHTICICDELYRNGFDTIVLVHGHGGNVPMTSGVTSYSLETRKPYSVYSIAPLAGVDVASRMESEHYGHACEMETSYALAIFPELVRMDRVQGRYWRPDPEGSQPQKHGIDTAINWIATWPDAVCGAPEKATAEKGRAMLDEWVASIVEKLRYIKQDRVLPEHMARSADSHDDRAN